MPWRPLLEKFRMLNKVQPMIAYTIPLYSMSWPVRDLFRQHPYLACVDHPTYIYRRPDNGQSADYKLRISIEDNVAVFDAATNVELFKL